MVDTPFLLISYKYIFNDPACCEYNFLYYLSMIIGSFFHFIYPSGGIFYYKMISILIYFISLSITWTLLKNYISRSYIIIGILLASTFKLPALNISHNSMTALFTLLAIWAIYSGLKNKGSILLLIGGILIGINTFTRLPNITMIILSLLVPINAYFNNIPKRIWITQFITVLSGVLLGILCIISFMHITGHWDIFLRSINTGTIVADSDASSHNPIILILNYTEAYLRIILFFIILVITWIYFEKILPRFKTKSIKYILGIGYCLLFPIVTLTLLTRSWGIITPIYYMLIFLASIYLVYLKNIDKYFKLIVTGNLLMLIFLPLGSDGYFILSRDTLTTISFPIILYFTSIVYNKKLTIVKHKYRIELHGQILSYIVCGIMAITTLHNIIYSAKVSGEVSWIWKRKYKIDAPLGKNIYTTKEWAARINSVVHALNKYVKPNDYIFLYTGTPIITYLTETKPYLPCASAVLCYPSASSFNLKIEDMEREIKEKPIVIIDNLEIYKTKEEQRKFSIIAENWPAMLNFLENNKYGIAWRNKYHTILLPESTIPAVFAKTVNYPLIINLKAQ